MHPALRNWRDELSSVLLHLTAYGGGLAAAAAFAVYIAQPPKVVAASEPMPRAEWIEVERPYAAFALSIPEAGDALPGYSIRRHVEGGRKDILRIGDAHGSTPFLQVEIYRPGREIESFADTASTVAALASPLGTASDVGNDADLDSKFGAFSLTHFSVNGASDAPRKCTGFVRAHGDPRLQIAGVFCQNEDYVARGVVACALDRLTLTTSGGDPKTGALFAQAELRRNFCGQRSTLMTPTPKYPTLWKAIEQRQAKSAR